MKQHDPSKTRIAVIGAGMAGISCAKYLREHGFQLTIFEKSRGPGGPLPESEHACAHRWRYARTTSPLGQRHLYSEDRTLFLGGDWCLGARVECAFESGQAIAKALTGVLRN